MTAPPNPPDPFAADRAEVERAAGHYYYSPQQLGIDARTKRLVQEQCEPFLVGPRILDLGYVDGTWADAALARGARVDIVEGAAVHVAHARARYGDRGDVRVFHCLFQEFQPDGAYDTIVAGDMLRYVPDDREFLARARAWLRPGGHLIVTVPNRGSLHRRIGTFLGMESSPDAPNARDREVGNRRTYDRSALRTVVERAGYRLDAVRGCFLKPLSSTQMQDWPDDLLRAFLRAGEELEDYCWFLYALATRE